MLAKPLACVADFVQAVSECELLKPEHLEEFRRDLVPRWEDVEALGQQLVEREWLTPYQVEQVLQGRARDLVLGTYRVLEPVGEGGMGQVFRAYHQRLNRVVGLKVIRQDGVAQDQEAIQRFQREA